ncbi:MAG: hypothetical protein OEY51_07715, partial [Cyclobacteriaceae bacterium]|nr:hypothetical protein [Cyclobacteriaceae bacterium]
MVKRARILGCFILLLIYGGQGHGQTPIAESRHNLSARSTVGTIKATSESQLCIFCHTSHLSKSSAKAPMWNKKDRGSIYVPYNGDPANISSTLNAAPGQPDGSSILCLSCHDGTIALGEVANRRASIDFSGVGQFMPTGSRGYLGTDLSDDHPISFTYNNALAVADDNLKSPGAISYPVWLESGKVQCVSCHSSHDNTNGKFLHVTKDYSA